MKNVHENSLEAAVENAPLLQSAIPDSVVQRLEDAAASRQIKLALGILKEWDSKILSLRFPQKNIAAMLCYFAWAMDMVCTYVPLVKEIIRRFEEQVPKGEISLLDSVYINIAQGLVALLRQERYNEAIRYFELAKFDADRVQNQELLTIANYYIGRGYLKNVNYEKALPYIHNAKRLDDLAGRYSRAAVIESIEGLILLLLGKTEKAEELFSHAETALKECAGDHLIEYGNLSLFRARIARRKGNYDEAEKRLWRGIESYKQQNESHRNIARAYIHLATIYRVKALRLEEEKRTPQTQEQIDRYRCQAIELLEKAEAIYSKDSERHQQQIGKVHLARALVFFDLWQFGDADNEAKEAFKRGQQHRDNLLMTKARIIQCKLALRDQREPNLRALALADDAVNYAQATEYPRLQARALTCQGRARLDVLNDVLGATNSWQAANRLLTSNDQDYVRDDLNYLKEDIDAYDSPSCEVIKLTRSDLTASDCRDFQQIMDEIGDNILQYLYGLMKGNNRQIAKTWHVSERKVRYAVRSFTLTEENSQRLAETLSETLSDKALKEIGKKRNLSIITPDEMDELKKLILLDLAELKGKEARGWAGFIRLVKEKVGYDEGNALKPALLNCFREPGDEAE